MSSTMFNHTQMSIEEAVSSAEFGERLISLAGEFRREGNHDAANVAFMGAAHILERLSTAIELLPIIAPEHAALLSESQRQGLTTQLNVSHQRLSALVAEHDASEVLLDDCDQRYEEWYASCLHIGHMAHLARNVAARAAETPPTGDLIEITGYALSQLHQGAQESMADLRDNQLPDNAPFPQTRNQLWAQAGREHAEVEAIHTRINILVAAAEAEADNSQGQCHLCRAVVRAAAAGAHVQNCITDAVGRNFIDNNTHGRFDRNETILLEVRSEELRHWMILAVRPTASLRQLDRFLRDHWLECCGHLSHFDLGGVRYSNCVPGPGDSDLFDADLAEPDERHMVYPVAETTVAGQEFRHEFDYGDTTRLDLTCVAVLRPPYQCLPQLMEWEHPEGHVDDFIAIVARNLRPERCFTCGEPASWRYHDNPYLEASPEQGGPIVAPPYFCDRCAPQDTTLTLLKNSPRSGVACYDNTHDGPVFPSRGNELPEDADGLRELLPLGEATHIIYWTVPQFNAADERLHRLADLPSQMGNDLAASLDAVEERILEWQRQFVDLMPESWQHLVNSDSVHYRVIEHLMDHQFEPDDDLDVDPARVRGGIDDTLAGIRDHYDLSREITSDLIQGLTTSQPAMTPADQPTADERIGRIVDIAREILNIGHDALTGAAVHAMAAASRSTPAEPPPSDAIANAARTLAFAGAVARAAAKIIEFRIRTSRS